MNKRWKELVVDAFFDESTNCSDSKMYHLGENKMEEFAKLIAQECADLCLKHAEFEGPFGVMEMRKGQNFYTIIRNHFGIAKGETE